MQVWQADHHIHPWQRGNSSQLQDGLSVNLALAKYVPGVTDRRPFHRRPWLREKSDRRLVMQAGFEQLAGLRPKMCRSFALEPVSKHTAKVTSCQVKHCHHPLLLMDQRDTSKSHSRIKEI